jgi:transcriptional regulator with XRE-family HTH domain
MQGRRFIMDTMKRYAEELKARRDAARMTVRQLGTAIGKSNTYVVDFENQRKSNPPEPEPMRRIGEVLGWPIADQLAAWGYALDGVPAQDDQAPIVEFTDRLRRIHWTPERESVVRGVLGAMVAADEDQ